MSSPMDIDDNKGKVKEQRTYSYESFNFDAKGVSPTRSAKMEEDEKEEADNNGCYGFVDALHALVKAEMEERDMGTEGAPKVGTTVTKEFAGRRCMGTVVSFHAVNNLFKVKYDNGKSENVDWNELEQIVAPPRFDGVYLEERQAREKRRKEKMTSETGSGSGMFFVENESPKRRKQGSDAE